MSAERPVIAGVDAGSDIACLIEEASCGICIPPEDAEALARAIMKLYSNRSLGAEMASNGLEYMRSNFALEPIARQYEDLLHSVTKHPAKSSTVRRERGPA
jgi:colanic acid biosynthesis glycosyl transferase WcaI